jgi:hypothetical protein
VAVAASLAGSGLTQWLIWTVGVVWSLGSLILGVIATATGSRWVPGALEPNTIDRYTAWFQSLGFPLPDGALRALEGLSIHRNLLGMLLALVLVAQLRHVLGLDVTRRTRYALAALGPGLTTLALVWTLSRTAIVAAVAGVAAGLLPVERIRRPWHLVAVSVVPILLVITPVIVRGILAGQSDPAGTLAWRVRVWDEFLASPGVWGPLGLGPAATVSVRQAHAHNQALDALVTGGWLGALSLLVLVLLATAASVRAAALDHRAAFSCIMAAAFIAQFEILTNPDEVPLVNPALVVLIAVVASSAGLSAAEDRNSRPHEVRS